jgi:carotenoid cleavage dioxygenase
LGKVAAFNRKRMSVGAAPHPFLSGIHTPMTQELTLSDLPVTGVIPPVFNGRYLRIGPNPVRPDPAGYHWFTGDGMVHGVALRNGRAEWYRNRWIRSRGVGETHPLGAAPGPRNGDFDTVNTNVVGIAGRTWALVEAGSYPVELSDTLDEQTFNPFDHTLAGSFTAHPHRDPLTCEHHAIAYHATDPARVRHIVLSAEGKVTREESIAVVHGPSIHDAGLTARYAVILDLPVTFSMKALIGGHGFPYRWNPAHQARVGLLPREGRGEDTIWCPVDPAYVFHVANSYDDAAGRVILDVIAYRTMFADGRHGPDGQNLGLERWTVDPEARTVERQTIDATPQEFPRPDERRWGQPYRYCYTMALPARQEDQFLGATALYKHDLEAGTRAVHDFGPGRHPGEFVFVPAHANAAEDEGYLIGLVIDLPADQTDLVILDARALGSSPVASVRLPHRVPPGFHGNWLSAR